MSKYPKVNYIGNKEKITEWIIDEFPIKKGTVLDLFSGGCSVSYALKENGFSVISNDVLYSNFIISKAIIENSSVKLDKYIFNTNIDDCIIKNKYDKIKFLSNRLYFDFEVKELATLLSISDTLIGYEKYIFLALLRRAMIRKLPYSRMNVPWEQIKLLRDEEYSYLKYKRKRAYHNQSFTEHMTENIDSYNNSIFSNKECFAYNLDALDMINKIDFVDAVYMDPPYPSTMNNYDSFYGSFDEMFDLRKQHIDFTHKNTFLENMELIIKMLYGKTKNIIISQNSRVQPSPNDMKNMLERHGKVTIKEKKHNYQVTGKDNKNENKELLFVLELKG